MTFYKFSEINSNHHFLGGKAHALGLLANAGFRVPPGGVLTEIPETDEEWKALFSWWHELGNPKLAVRSSAQGEDSGEQSFAGQNSTYLNIDNSNDLKLSIEKCFQSFYKKSSALYREHFLKDAGANAKMNVVLQKMVQPLFSGVYFSIDPRSGEKSWVLEAITGYGEDLVSGKKTPMHFEEKNFTSQIPLKNIPPFNLIEVIETGKNVRDFFGVEIDMEWAIDEKHQFYVLQARPVTALAGKSTKIKMIQEEIQRITNTHPADTVWDGQTFSEFNGPPTELTFSIWKKAFAKNGAFSLALKKLQYLGINQELANEEHSLMEKIFGRAYVNVSMMAPLYFGPIPYKIDLGPAPKLKFDWSRMSLPIVLKTPWTMAKMLKVGWHLATQRRDYLNECAKELSIFSPEIQDHKFSEMELPQLLDILQIKSSEFHTKNLLNPLILIILIESTLQTLRSLLKGVLSAEEIEKKLREWMAFGIQTVTMKMNQEYRNACLTPSLREPFLIKYGHRGPGELELQSLRWRELGDNSFVNLSKNKNVGSHTPTSVTTKKLTSVEDDIASLKTYKAQAIIKEWQLLKEMLELREAWKMALLRPYFDLRLIVSEIANKTHLSDHIFWHSLDEILAGDFNQSRAIERKNKNKILKTLSLPPILKLNSLVKTLMPSETGEDNTLIKNGQLIGTPLSPGLAFGEVRVVLNPHTEDLDQWPSDVILVAESTDPGWTALFLKARGVIVEKGGVLSHCAIVAREMNLPAVSEIKQCHLNLKNGDKIWVDGNNGRITMA